MNKLVVCLTGGIASGKTHVSDRLGMLGAAVIDTDVIAREVVTPGSVGLDKITQIFGPTVLAKTGELDRQQLKQLVFNDKHQLEKLNTALHPLIWQAAKQQSLANRNELEVWVVPLYEGESPGIVFDRILVVDVAPKTQMKRLQKRDQVSEKMAASIAAAQLSRDARLQLATDVISNNQTLADLDRKIDGMHELYTALKAVK